jgi:hypothetical protein
MIWLVIAIPASAVIVGAIMITLSFTTFDGVIEDDYYIKGKEINQLLERDEFALDNGIAAIVQIDDQTGVIAVALNNTTDYEFSDQLGISLLHPTQSRRDVKLLLSKGPDGRYYSELGNPLTDGRWYFRISEPKWRLQKLISWPVSNTFEMNSDD